MPRVRINLRDLEEIEELDDLEELEELEAQTDQEKRIKPRDRAERRKPISHEARMRRLDQRRKGKEFSRMIRQRSSE